jgi:hypothetical protein
MTSPASEPYQPRLTEQQYQAILHQPKLVAHLQRIAQKGAEEANHLAAIPDAVYGTMTQNTPTTRRARVYVRPINAEATLDDAYHTTMYKAISAMKGL